MVRFTDEERVAIWFRGKSARTVTHCWKSARGFPPEIASALATAEASRDCEFLVGLPKHKVHCWQGVEIRRLT